MDNENKDKYTICLVIFGVMHLNMNDTLYKVRLGKVIMIEFN